MAIESKIQWTQATWNPWHGCKKVSEGCKYCYMYRKKAQYHQEGSIVKRSRTKFNEPKKWLEPKVVFTCSWSDWFIDEADAWRPEAWDIVRDTPHTYQILTKRAERILSNLPPDWGHGYKNVWLGVSVESNKYKDRIDHLLKAKASVRFASLEPLIGEVEWDSRLSALDWIIIGGESGNQTGQWRYRPMELKWVEHLVENAIKNNVKVFVKQLGTHLAKELGLKDTHGGEIAEWGSVPHLQVRQMPDEAGEFGVDFANPETKDQSKAIVRSGGGNIFAVVEPIDAEEIQRKVRELPSHQKIKMHNN